MRRLAVLACLVAGTLLASPTLAQEGPGAGDQVVVTLDSGATFRGTVVGQDDRLLTIRSSAGSVRALPRTAISRVEITARAAPPPPPAAATEPPAASPAVPAVLAVAAEPATPAPARAQPADPPAQAQPPARGPLIGLGVGLLAGGGSPVFYLPVEVRPGLRVEPEFGLVAASSSNASASQTQVGLGVLGVRQLAPQVNAYGGGRFSILMSSATGTESRTGLRWAAVGGGEWLPVPRVALGVELQVAYARTSATAANTASSTVTSFSTASLALLRIYLN